MESRIAACPIDARVARSGGATPPSYGSRVQARGFGLDLPHLASLSFDMTMHHDSEFNIEELLPRFHKRLSEAGLKSTRQRDAIFETFFRLDKHISVDELLEEVRKDSPNIGYATVYRTLKLLVEHHFATPRQFGDGQTRFDPTTGKEDEHDHLICVDCRRVIEFEDATVNARLGQIVEELGSFKLSRRRVELYARCTLEDCEHRADKGS